MLAQIISPLALTLFATSTVAIVGWALAVRSHGKRRKSDEIHRRHRELSLDLICTASFSGHFVELSPSWKRVLGYDLSELVERPFTDFIHPDDVEGTLAEVEKQANLGHHVFNFQNRYRAADGSYRWLEWSSRPDYDAGLMFAIARDITERKRAEEIVARYREVLETTVAERTAELEEARWETLHCLALAAEYRDDQTFEHTQRVGRTSALIAKELGLESSFVELIRHAAPLHDVGKVGIPDSILLKPGKLSPDEFAIIHRHAEAGNRILGGSKSPLLNLAAEIALTHHEWWDGSGYPAGLVGSDIPLSGRIVALADVFDALTHDRPYKPAWSVADSLVELERLRGLQFDPTLLDAFAQLDPEPLVGRPDRRRHLTALPGTGLSRAV